MARPAAGNADGSPRLELADFSIGEAEGPAVSTEAETPTEAEPTEAELSADEQAILQRVLSAPKGQEEPDTVRLETEQGDEQPAPVRSGYYGKKKQKKEAEQSALYLIMILEGAAILAFGEEARLLPFEKQMIVDPMARMMMRADPQVMEAVEKWTDPVLILFGLMTWGSRMYAIAEDKRGNDGPPPSRKPPSDATPPRGPNGNGRTLEEAFAERDPVMSAGPGSRILGQVTPTTMNQ